jgi:hypothetical protein
LGRDNNQQDGAMMDRSEGSKERLRIENKRLRRKIRELESEIVLSGALFQDILDALEGEEPSDFALSFWPVRKVWELRQLEDT